MKAEFDRDHIPFGGMLISKLSTRGGRVHLKYEHIFQEASGVNLRGFPFPERERERGPERSSIKRVNL